MSIRAFLAACVLRREFALAALLLAALAAGSALNPAFATWHNAADLLSQAAPALIVGCGLTMVCIAGEIDVSVGSQLGLLAALLGILSSPQHLGWPTPAVAAAVLVAGAFLGLLNGAVVILARVPSLVVTLGMLTILRGLTNITMGGRWITDLAPSLRTLGTYRALGLTPSVYASFAMLLLAGVYLSRTPWGRRIYAIGSSPAAAALSRIRVPRVKLGVFTLTGVCTAVAALLTIPQQSVVESGIGNGFELVVITAVVVGGTSIRGGSGGVLGTALAILLLCTLRTILIFLKSEDAVYWERTIQGSLILTALLLDRYSLALRSAPRGAIAR